MIYHILAHGLHEMDWVMNSIPDVSFSVYRKHVARSVDNVEG